MQTGVQRTCPGWNNFYDVDYSSDTKDKGLFYYYSIFLYMMIYSVFRLKSLMCKDIT